MFLWSSLACQIPVKGLQKQGYKTADGIVCQILILDDIGSLFIYIYIYISGGGTLGGVG